MHEESLRITRKALGNEHPGVAESLNSLALLLCDQVGLMVHTLLTKQS